MTRIRNVSWRPRPATAALAACLCASVAPDASHGLEIEQVEWQQFQGGQFQVRGGIELNCGVGLGGPIFINQWDGPTEIHHHDNQLVDGFNVAAGGKLIQDTAAGEALELIAQKQWLKAIQKIESMSDEDKSMVLDSRGILRPLSAIKTQLITTMPAEGRSVFRRMNDPAAQALLEEARKAGEQTEKIALYGKIAREYMLCDASAKAAEEFGDLLFEMGRFAQAATMYRQAAEHPSSTSDDPMLMARRLVALSRVGLWRAFDDLAEYAKFRHAETSVTLGGESVKLPGLIKQLAAQRGKVTVVAKADSKKLLIPKGDQRAFDRHMLDPVKRKGIQFHASQNGIGMHFDQLTRPVVATDGQRLFTLSFGQVKRLDPQTGSELWADGDVDKNLARLQGSMYYLRSGYPQSLTISDDTLLAVVPEENTAYRTQLKAINPETGEVKWVLQPNTSSSSDNKIGDNFVGQPLIVDDKIYMTTIRRGNTRLNLVVLSLSDGSLIKSIHLGSIAFDQNNNGAVELVPQITLGRDHLYVQTNNGAMIAVDTNEDRIAWAFSQKVRASGVSGNMRNGLPTPPPARNVGSVMARGGMVFAKDSRSNKVHAFREHNAEPVWQSQVDSDATIVHVDNRHVYVQGKHLVAFNLQTGKRVWWTDHTGTRSGRPVFTDTQCFVAGNSMLGAFELSTGRLTEMNNDSVMGGHLARVGDHFIHVTHDKITGLPFKTLP